MIVGIGIDLVEIARFQRALKRGGNALAERLFTPSEIGYCKSQRHPAQHYAARFAAKEALLKALGTGWSGGIAWTDIETVADRNGSPRVKLSGMAKNLAQKMGIARWLLSMSHTDKNATAIVIAER